MWETLLEGKGEGKHNLGIRRKKRTVAEEKTGSNQEKAYGKFET
jgi:hypothetical protein